MKKTFIIFVFVFSFILITGCQSKQAITPNTSISQTASPDLKTSVPSEVPDIASSSVPNVKQENNDVPQQTFTAKTSSDKTSQQSSQRYNASTEKTSGSDPVPSNKPSATKKPNVSRTPLVSSRPTAATQSPTTSKPVATPKPSKTSKPTVTPTPKPTESVQAKSAYEYPFDKDQIKEDMIAKGKSMGLKYKSTGMTPDNSNWAQPITGSETFQGEALKKALMNYVAFHTPENLGGYGGSEAIQYFSIYVRGNTFYFLY